MAELFNPFNRRVTGEAFNGLAPVQLRVEEGTASRNQVRAAQDAFARFARRATFSHVPNPTEGGVLGDGSPYRITTVGNTTTVQLWPVNLAQEGGQFKSGILVTLGGDRRNQVFLVPRGKFGKPTGVWDLIRVRNWVHAFTASSFLPTWAHTSWQSAEKERYAVGGLTAGRGGVSELTMDGGATLLLDLVKQANGRYVAAGISDWPGRFTFYKSGDSVADPLTAQYQKFRQGNAPAPKLIGLGAVSVPFMPSVGNSLEAVSRSRNGDRITTTTRQGGGPPLLPFDGGTIPTETQLGFRVSLALDLFVVGENWLEPRPIDNNSQLVATTKNPGSVFVDEYRFNRATLALGAANRIYSAPAYSLAPRPFYQVGSDQGGGAVRIFQTFRDCSYVSEVPEEEVLVDVPGHWHSACHGDAHYKEWFDSVNPGVYGVWYQADNERVMVPSTAEEHYSAESTGKRDYDNILIEGSLGYSDVQTAQMTVQRIERETLHLPGGRDFLKLDFVVNEVCSAREAVTGPVTHVNTRHIEFSGESSYTVRALCREVLVVDPFLELLVYVECDIQYARTVTANGYYSWDMNGGNAGHMPGYPFLAQTSGGGPLPDVPALNLVVEFKGVARKYPMKWAESELWFRRFMGAASVPIPITEPQIVLNGTAAEMGMDFFVWQNRFDRVRYLLDQTLVGNTEVGDPKALSTGLIRSRPTQWSATARGKVVSTLVRAPIPSTRYCKDPLTGAAVLWVRGENSSQSALAPLMFLIDRHSCRPVQSLDSAFPITRITQVTEA